jgi:hypothetical protein
LAQDATAPAYDYDYRYQLPTSPKCLRLMEVYENRSYGDYKYDIEAGYVVTDSDSCRVKYLAKETDTTKYDTLFVEALSATLAAKLALSITNSLQVMQRMEQLAGMAIDAATQVDAIESDPKDQPVEDDGSWIKDR